MSRVNKSFTSSGFISHKTDISLPICLCLHFPSIPDRLRHESLLFFKVPSTLFIHKSLWTPHHSMLPLILWGSVSEHILLSDISGN